VRVENRQVLDQALARGNGCIVLTAHLGNWELGGVVLSQLGYPLWAVALPHKSKKVDKFFNFQRESKGLRVIPLGKAFIKCVNILKSNEVIALVGDRDFTKDGGIVVDFFGKPAYLPKGPAMISLMTGAPIIPAFMIRNKIHEGFTMRFEKPVDFNGGEKPSAHNGKSSRIRKVRDEEVKKLTQSCARVMEEYIKRFPEQWYMFKKFWVE
jgi:KDO2-lipid IV(A) lauroyltransferase